MYINSSFLKTLLLVSALAWSSGPVASAQQQDRNLALNRAAYTSGAADWINTGHMATDGRSETKWRSLRRIHQQDQTWIYVDLGAESVVNKVVLKWGGPFPAKYKIQVSTNAAPSPQTGRVENWQDVSSISNCLGGVNEIPLTPVKARYVRLWCPEQDQGMPEGVELNEFEVYGSGGLVTTPAPLPPPAQDGTWNLSGNWRLVSQNYEKNDAAVISRAGFDDHQWLPATVPGTVLTSYLNDGAIPDPFYADQQQQVSDWFCRSKWWYRMELVAPEYYREKRIWLNLDGINHRGEIFVNGSAVGTMAGAFAHGKFDISGKLAPGATNCIAILIHPLPKPLDPVVKSIEKYFFRYLEPNAPCFVESGGWDWIPCIGDRNIGVWNKVWLSTSGDVTIADPFVVTELPLLPDISRADLTIKALVKNNSAAPCNGTVRGSIGDITFKKQVQLGANQAIEVVIDKTTQPSLSMVKPNLWWPNGYGDPHLYNFTICFEKDNGVVTDTKKSKVGIRKFTYQKDPLTILCNGRKIMVKGANWGMEEGLLRCDRAGFETRLRLEREMNFTMIRNCLGNVAKEDFYDLCDQYGLMVFDDFWSNHGSPPDDIPMFLANARDKLLAVRNHACVALLCSANEGGPCKALADKMPGLVAQMDNTRLYLHNSTQMGPDGPYETFTPRFYPKLAKGWRTEVGSPVIPCVESMRRMMPWDQLWPIGAGWGAHDWAYGGGFTRPELASIILGAGTTIADGPRPYFCKITEQAVEAYGAPTGIEDCCRKAQMVNMETFKSIFEAWNDKLWNDCTGVMLWMSNPVWPSLIWNTYDYYFEPTAVYFACKKACEPIHVQWNMVSGNVKVINNTFADLNEVQVQAHIYQMDGREHFQKSAVVNCPANAATTCFQLNEADSEATKSKDDLSDAYFIKLDLKDANGKSLSDNFYWQSRRMGDYRALQGMPTVTATGTVSVKREKETCKLLIHLQNSTNSVALMLRVKLVDSSSGQLVAPLFYSDNYVSLTPGESKNVTVEFDAGKIHGHEASVRIEGWNVAPAELAKIRL